MVFKVGPTTLNIVIITVERNIAMSKFTFNLEEQVFLYVILVCRGRTAVSEQLGNLHLMSKLVVQFVN